MQRAALKIPTLPQHLLHALLVPVTWTVACQQWSFPIELLRLVTWHEGWLGLVAAAWLCD